MGVDASTRDPSTIPNSDLVPCCIGGERGGGVPRMRALWVRSFQIPAPRIFLPRTPGKPKLRPRWHCRLARPYIGCHFQAHTSCQLRGRDQTCSTLLVLNSEITNSLCSCEPRKSRCRYWRLNTCSGPLRTIMIDDKPLLCFIPEAQH
jgi:hypothetical protein